MEMSIVSIIVPVYKTELFIDKCVKSLISQTYPYVEIILVEDGSPDGCAEKCDFWKKTDARVKVIHQPNQGVTKARANGVGIASGKWILFVDSDDTLPLDAVDNMIKTVGDNDILVGQVDFKGPYLWPYKKKKGQFNREQYLKALLKRKQLHSGPVAKLFKRSLFDDFTFDLPNTIKCGEDYIMNLRLANNSTKIKIVETIVYYYVFREGSAVTKNPFVSVSFVILFQQLILKSVRVTSLSIALYMFFDFLCRMIVCFKLNVRKFASNEI